jgi:hypothetical protein
MLLHASGQHPQGSYKLVRTAYRDFFQWAEDEELVERSPAKRMPKSRPQQTKVYDIFTPVEQAQLVRAADRMPLPWVQRLRVLAFVDLGIRSEEARLMQPRDVDLASRTVVVRGKGDKERVVPFSEDFFRAFVGFRNRPIPNVRMADAHGRFREARAPLDDDYLFFPLGFVKASGCRDVDGSVPAVGDRAMRSWWDEADRDIGRVVPQPAHEPAHARDEPVGRRRGDRDDRRVARPCVCGHDEGVRPQLAVAASAWAWGFGRLAEGTGRMIYRAVRALSVPSAPVTGEATF